MPGYPCPEDLAGPLRDLLTGSAFEVRACRDLLRQMQAPQDREARVKVDRTLKALEAHAQLLPPLLHTGDQVRLQFEGWPAIQFVGWPSVAVGTFAGEVKLLDATDDGTGRFRILVEPDASSEAWPESRYLRQGVRANGWVLLQQVKLGFEVWRRFNGFPPTITKSAEPAPGDTKNKK